MIEALFVFLALAMLRVKDGDRLAASVFTMVTIGFYYVDMVLPDWAYYITAAAVDLGIIAALLFLQRSTNARLVKVLSMACLASIGIQIIGYAVCVTHGNGAIYDNAAIMFYVVVIGIFLTWNKLDGALSRHISDAPWFFHHSFSRPKTHN